jgi:16S rRNA (cytidine1402-2'-O)-methyltransferase
MSGPGRGAGSGAGRGAGSGPGRGAGSGSGRGGAPGWPAPPGQGSGQLFVVATPIGNLGDISFRAVEVLKTVPLVAAEDTRLTRRLFARYEIGTALVSYHARSAPERRLELLEHLRTGRDLALVTDAGTPLISDPGAELTAAWAAEGGAVVPIPGPSAALAALVASGLAAARWSFEGFLPRGGKERRDRLERVASDERACVIFEAPSRVPATLADLAAACAGRGSAVDGAAAQPRSRRAAVCRELTKIHEEVVRGPLEDLAAKAAAGGITLRGEFVIVVEAAAPGAAVRQSAPSAPGSIAAGRVEVDRLVATGMKRSAAVRQVAAASGLDRRELYRPG